MPLHDQEATHLNQPVWIAQTGRDRSLRIPAELACCPQSRCEEGPIENPPQRARVAHLPGLLREFGPKYSSNHVIVIGSKLIDGISVTLKTWTINSIYTL